MKDPFKTRVTKNDKKSKKGLYTQKYIRLKQETLNNSKKFYWLTRYLELSYMWYDKKRKVIELWGPFDSLQNFQAHQILECELNLSCNKIEV